MQSLSQPPVPSMRRILEAHVYQAGQPIPIKDVELELPIRILLLVVFIGCEWSIPDVAATRLGANGQGCA
jgi:hypothetical protein